MDKKYKTVFNANGQLEAQMVKMYLESFGIDTLVTQESFGSTFGLTLGPLGNAEIMVKTEDAEKALELLAAMDSEDHDQEE